MPQAEARLAEESVGEVPEGAPEQHPEQHGPGHRADATCVPDDEDDDGGRDDGEEPGRAAGEGEGGTRVLHEVQLEHVAQDGNAFADVEVRDDEEFGELIDREDAERHERQHDESRSPHP